MTDLQDTKAYEPTDTKQAQLGFGHGGVPWPLLIFYLSFLVFAVWYTLEYQLPDYLDEQAKAAEVVETE